MCIISFNFFLYLSNAWQSCYYVPPSLRARAPIARTPPSGMFICLPVFKHGKLKALPRWTAFDVFFPITAGTKDLLEQQTAKKYPGALSDSRIAGNFSPKAPSLLSIGSNIFIPFWYLLY